MPKRTKELPSNEDLMRQAEIALIRTPISQVINFGAVVTRKPTSYGVIVPEMKKAIKRHIKGQVVFDLGAGNLVLSQELLKLGAGHIIAIDKEPSKAPNKRITVFATRYDEFLKMELVQPKEGDVAFLSWPSNHMMNGLIRLVERFDTVIYLGQNTDGRACAWPAFFHRLYLRPIIEHIIDRANTLIIYGKVDKNLAQEHRLLVLEERAGGDQSRQYNFEEQL